MCQELIKLAEDFTRYRKGRPRVKYPKVLWVRAAQLCTSHPLEKVASSLGVSCSSIRRQLQAKKVENNLSPSFAPIAIAPQHSVQLHLGGPLPITIEFDRSTEELVQFILALQRGIPC